MLLLTYLLLLAFMLMLLLVCPLSVGPFSCKHPDVAMASLLLLFVVPGMSTVAGVSSVATNPVVAGALAAVACS
jgi:hypothetical protein